MLMEEIWCGTDRSICQHNWALTMLKINSTDMPLLLTYWICMITSSNGNIFLVTGHLYGHRWIPHTKANDAELWCFIICAWINDWVNNREAGDLRRHCAHFDVTLMVWRWEWWQYEDHFPAIWSAIENVTRYGRPENFCVGSISNRCWN